MNDWLDRCTPAARQAMSIAMAEAEASEQECLRPEHLLFGIATELTGAAGRRVRELGLDGEAIRRSVAEKTKKASRGASAPVYLHPEVKEILAAIIMEVADSPELRIGSRRLLIGLLTHPTGSAAKLLVALGISPLTACEISGSD